MNQRTMLLTCVALLLLIPKSFAGNEEKIDLIRKEYESAKHRIADINDYEKWKMDPRAFHLTKVAVNEESLPVAGIGADRAEIRFYYSSVPGEAPQIVMVKVSQEHGAFTYEREFLFDEEAKEVELIFALVKGASYAKESNDVVQWEDRFYFVHGKLIRFMDHQKVFDSPNPEQIERSKNILLSTKRFTDLFLQIGVSRRQGDGPFPNYY